METIDVEKGNDKLIPDCSDQKDIDCHAAIHRICDNLSITTKEFNKLETYKMIEEFEKKYNRWYYSDISNYLFLSSSEFHGVFISNIVALQGYAREMQGNEKIQIMINKLWDHSNLAETQFITMKNEESTFKAKFEKNITPYTSEFSREMNKQLISLIAIFTALSFIIFGGISSLDNVFEGVTKPVPIIELVIIGVIWSIGILNLIFVFMFFVAKLTKLSIKSDERANASISQKYPFLIWSNFFLLLILAIFSWLYYIDYTNSGSWLIKLSQQNDVFSTLIGVLLIGIVFGVSAHLLVKKTKNIKGKKKFRMFNRVAVNINEQK